MNIKVSNLILKHPQLKMAGVALNGQCDLVTIMFLKMKILNWMNVNWSLKKLGTYSCSKHAIISVRWQCCKLSFALDQLRFLSGGLELYFIERICRLALICLCLWCRYSMPHLFFANKEPFLWINPDNNYLLLSKYLPNMPLHITAAFLKDSSTSPRRFLYRTVCKFSSKQHDKLQPYSMNMFTLVGLFNMKGKKRLRKLWLLYFYGLCIP